MLLVSSVWGGWLGAATALASALAFNFFHIPPTGRFTISEGENWVALVVFFIAALVASTLAERARVRTREAQERRQEADLAAEMARLLLRGASLDEALPDGRAAPGARARAAVGGDRAARRSPGDERRVALALGEPSARSGTLLVPRRPAARGPRAPAASASSPRSTRSSAPRSSATALQREVVETSALRRSDVLKTALLRAVSHDLRSPLTAILTAAGALDSASLSPAEHRELVADITGEAGRLVAPGRQPARHVAPGGRARPSRACEWCSVEEVVLAAVDDIALPPGTFALAIDPDLPLIRADAAQLERAFANLLENSARYWGGHPVSVRARAVGSRILVRIVDRGPGVPAAEQERIFEAFHRAPGDPDGHRGSGLGLAIVRGFIEANGGRVWVESLPGQGATFVVELPVEEVPRMSERPRVLVVDDERQILRALKVILRDAGYDVDRGRRRWRRRWTAPPCARPTRRSST